MIEIESSGTMNFGDNWCRYGSGSYKKADAFAKHAVIVQHCRYCNNSNEVRVRARTKEIVMPTIL